MARKPTNKPTQKKIRKPFEFKGYVSYNLTSDAKESYDNWIKTQTIDTLLARVEALSDRFKISIAYDVDNECGTATMSCIDDTADVFGYVLSARSDESIAALWLLIFKHDVCLQESWIDRIETGTKKRTWG